MPELVVDAAALVEVAQSVVGAASTLGAVSAALPGRTGEVGPVDVAHALEDAAHVWQHALRGVALALDAASQRLVSAASSYDAVEAMVGDWTSR